MKPDLESIDSIYELKCRNWKTDGTAGEKILGTPYKYANVPREYGKKLQIITIAYQEDEALNKFNLFKNASEEQQKILDFWKSMQITFVPFSTLLFECLSKLIISD